MRCEGTVTFVDGNMGRCPNDAIAPIQDPKCGHIGWLCESHLEATLLDVHVFDWGHSK